jgi:hypothetical protein
LVLVTWFISANGLIHGQKATELYTPIGKSPGLSGKLTVVGSIESVNEESRSITIAGPSETRSAHITDRTKIYLDRSKLGQPNRYGAFSDLEKGLRAEVLYENRERGVEGPAEWVKVEVSQDSP